MRFNKVFLGGTCGNSTWRESFCDGSITVFNPVVEDWNSNTQVEEDKQKAVCNFHLYGLTKEQSGCYTFFEISKSIREYKKVVLLVLDILENENMKSTVEKIIKDVEQDNIPEFYDIETCKLYLQQET